MAFESWAVLAFLCFMAGVSPGPAVFLTVSNVIRYGRHAAIVSGTGNAVGLVVLGLCIGLGLGSLMHVSSMAFTALKIVGAIYLIWLGVKSWRAKGSFAGTEEGAPAPSDMSLFRASFILSITNPKAIVIMGAMFPAFMQADSGLLEQSTIMALTYAFMCFVVHYAIAYMGEYIRPFFQSSQRLKYLRRTIGGLFIGFGLSLVASK